MTSTKDLESAVGDETPSNTSSTNSFVAPSLVTTGIVAVSGWNEGISNQSLKFSDNNLACMRQGSASCYPAAFAELPGNFCIFTTELTETGSSTNWLSIGIGKRGFLVSNSDGFGRTMDSLGIADDRSRDTDPAFFAINSEKVATAPRSLKRGDIITVIANFTVGVVEIVINYGEFSHIFGSSALVGVPQGGGSGVLSTTVKALAISHGRNLTLHSVCSTSETVNTGHHNDFLFGATFANDHKLRIDPFVPVSRSSGGLQRMGLDRLLYQTKHLQVLGLRQWFEIPPPGQKGDEEKEFESIQSTSEWLDTTLFMGGNFSSQTTEQSEIPIVTQDPQILLRLLSDAPNGRGDSQYLVQIMKAHVLQDRGRDPALNHLAHAACAALLWHGGLGEEAVQLVRSVSGDGQGGNDSEQRIELPSERIITSWRVAQELRTFYLSELNSEDYGIKIALVDVDENDNAPPPPIPIHRVHSLPPLEDSEHHTLNPVILGAIRRARLLIDFTPASYSHPPNVASQKKSSESPNAA